MIGSKPITNETVLMSQTSGSTSETHAEKIRQETGYAIDVIPGVMFLEQSEMLAKFYPVYREIFSGKPWNEKPEELTDMKILERLKNQLDNNLSRILLLTTQSGEIVGFANGQILPSSQAITRISQSVKSYLGKTSEEKTFLENWGVDNKQPGYIQLGLTSHGINHDIQHTEMTIIYEEFGIIKSHRSLSNLLKLAYELFDSMEKMGGNQKLNFIMWTKSSGNMKELASSTGMDEIYKTSGEHNGEPRELSVFIGNTGSFKEMAKNSQSFYLGIIMRALAKAKEGDFSLLLAFITKFSRKLGKGINKLLKLALNYES